jgi:predicted DNA-binding ribbon-helix-helix protein
MIKPRQISVRVEEPLWHALEQVAERDRRPVGALIRLVLSDWAAGRLATPPPSQRTATA